MARIPDHRVEETVWIELIRWNDVEGKYLPNVYRTTRPLTDEKNREKLYTAKKFTATEWGTEIEARVRDHNNATSASRSAALA